MDKPLIVGESNPYGGDDEFALYPSPDGCSGHRLCCLILGMRRKDYLEAFDRVDLCAGAWSVRAARQKVRELDSSHPGPRVLLGAKVCSVFGLVFQPYLLSRVRNVEGPPNHARVVVLPHPSGRCRLWAEPDAFVRARAAVTWLCPELAHLLGKE